MLCTEHFGFNHEPIKVIYRQLKNFLVFLFSFSFSVSIKSIRTKKTRKLVDRQCSTLEDLIEANVGEDVQLLTVDSSSHTKEWISGTLTSVKRNETMVEDDSSNDINPGTLPPIHSARSCKLNSSR